jgi:hypothetical protein
MFQRGKVLVLKFALKNETAEGQRGKNLARQEFHKREIKDAVNHQSSLGLC